SIIDLYTLSLHDALPILKFIQSILKEVKSMEKLHNALRRFRGLPWMTNRPLLTISHPFWVIVQKEVSDHLRSWRFNVLLFLILRSEEHTSELQSRENLVC